MKIKIPKYLAIATILTTTLTACSYDEFVEAIDWKSIDIFRFDSSPLTYKIDNEEIVKIDILKRDDQVPPELEYPPEYTGIAESGDLANQDNLGTDSSGTDGSNLTSGQKFDSLKDALRKTKEGKNKYLPFNSGIIVNHMGNISSKYLANTDSDKILFHNGIDIIPLLEPEVFYKLLEIRGTMDEVLTKEQIKEIEETFTGETENIAIHPSSSTGEKEISKNVLTVTYTENATTLAKEQLLLIFLANEKLSIEELNKELSRRATENRELFMHAVNMLIAQKLLDNSNVVVENSVKETNGLLNPETVVTGLIRVSDFKTGLSLLGLKKYEKFLDIDSSDKDVSIQLTQTFSTPNYKTPEEVKDYYKKTDKQWIDKTAEYLKMKQNSWKWTERETFNKLLQMKEGSVLEFNGITFSRKEILDIIQNMYTAESNSVKKADTKSKEAVETYRVRYYPVVGAENGAFSNYESLGHLGVSKNNISTDGLPYLHMDMIVSETQRSILAFNKSYGLFETKKTHDTEIRNEGTQERYSLILGESGFYEKTQSLAELQKHYGGMWGSSTKSYHITSKDQHLNTVAYKYGNKSFEYEKEENNAIVTEIENLFNAVFEPKEFYEEQQNKAIKDMGF